MTDTLDLAAFGITSLDQLDSLGRVAEAQTLLASAGTCQNPIRLAGGREVVCAATGELLDATSDRVITVPCGNRRASKCAYCSTLYKYDAYNLVVAGMRGGKQTPDTVSANPRLFVTVTAPSFGPVHLGPAKDGTPRCCNPRRDGSGCGRWHRAGDELIGTPLDPDSYDYVGHVLFNAMAGRLWSATMTEIRRSLARLLGVTRRELASVATVTFAKVAEYQARGIVHFHTVARLDGPDGPGSTPPAAATPDLFEQAIRDGIGRASVHVPESRALGGWPLSWGRQLGIRPITSSDFTQDGTLTDQTVARYIAKYATKSAEAAGVELPPIACRWCTGSGVYSPAGDPDPCAYCTGTGRSLDLDQWNLTDHARRLIETCWRLGEIPELADLKPRRWAHMLGFGGHFATKSRTYSTTFGALRQERADYTAGRDSELAALGESPDLIVINHWAYAGRDHALTWPEESSPRIRPGRAGT